jgi:drug/metabolite transporter (DMT)-like permease
MKQLSHLAGLGFAVIFGFSFLFSKVALEYVSPIGLISYRFLVAFLAFEGCRRLKIIHIRFETSMVRYWLPVAIFQPILYFLFETYGVSFTTSGEAGMMIALIPVFVSLFSGLLLKEKPRAIQMLFILFSLCGIVLIQLSSLDVESSSRVLGFVLLFAAVLSASLFNIASRKASLAVKPIETTYFMMLTGAVVFNLIYLGMLLIEGNVSTYITNFTQVEFLGPLFYLGIVASLGGFFLVNYALSKLQAHVSSIYSNLSTIVAIVAGAVILGEELTLWHIVGSVMIITGVYGTVWFNQRNIHRNT